jgi:hypothetical protein
VYSRSGDSAVIVTNAHVVRPPNGGAVSDIQVVFQNGERARVRCTPRTSAPISRS